MAQFPATMKPLFLSAEEAMGLLSLCMMSYEDIDLHRERAIQKLTEVVRLHIAEESERPVAASLNAAVPHRHFQSM